MVFTLRFHIEYRTGPGESLAVSISGGRRGRETCKRVGMQTEDGRLWRACEEADLDPGTKYAYGYAVVKGGAAAIAEKACPAREFTLTEGQREFSFYDLWRWDTRQLNLRSSAFTDCVFRFRGGGTRVAPAGAAEVKVHALLPQDGSRRLLLTGSCGALGGWDAGRGVRMERTGAYTYSAILPCGLIRDAQYKYVVADKDGGSVTWENGGNRVFPPLRGEAAAIDDGWVRAPEYADWRGAGIVVPLFSLHTAGSSGIGDFGDLKRFAAWAAGAGLSAVQILPVNDTNTDGTWRDANPYNPVSAFALNPVYIDLRELAARYRLRPEAKSLWRSARLNGKRLIDYESALKCKSKALKAIYREAKGSLGADRKFRAFVAENEDWLTPYAAYRSMRGKPESPRAPQTDRGSCGGTEAQDAADKAQAEETQYWLFLQYTAFRQMKAARDFARRRGVILKGDIPIGVNPCGADVRACPSLFNLDKSAGTPPDFFSKEGQNWGFPTYNWEEMERDGFAWWKRRFAVMSRNFDACRIDHVLGFFRIWEMPRGERTAENGRFSPALPLTKEEIGRAIPAKPEYTDALFLRDEKREDLFHVKINARSEPAYRSLDEKRKKAFDKLYDDFFCKRHESLWAQGAVRKLGATANAARMLPCAEDLGMLPSNIGETLDSLGILSLQVQSMPKRPGAQFADTARYPYRSVATISTHDMPPFRLWWKRNPKAARDYARMLRTAYTPEASVEACEKAVRLHLDSPSMLCMLSFQDWTSVCGHTRAACSGEQINNPASPGRNWRYKTHLSIEDLERDTAFSAKIREMLTRSGRNLFTAALRNNI